MRSDKQTTKLRIVFDAFAKRDGPSLNDCVYAGPPLSPLLMDLMMRFRCFKVAPLTGETIPRQELLRAVILIRLMKSVADALSEILKVDKFRYWVDSTGVLYWIIGEKKQWK